MSTNDEQIRSWFCDPSANLIAAREAGDAQLIAAAIIAHPTAWGLLDVMWMEDYALGRAVPHGDDLDIIHYTAKAVLRVHDRGASL
jgi:hypothetical protein